MAVFAVGAALVAGCGGGDGDSVEMGDGRASTEARIGLPVFVSSLTRVQYLSKANRLCRISWADMLEEYARYRRERGSRENDRELFAFVSGRSFLPHMQFWFDDISHLGSPKGDEEEVEDMLKALQWAVFAGADQRIASPTMMVAVFSSFNRLARAYGLDDCLVEVTSF